MSVSLKIFIGFLVLVSLMQLIDMAPQEAAGEQSDSMKAVNDIVEQLKNAVNDENFKKFLDSASNILSDGAKAFESNIKELQEKIGEKKQ